MLERNRNNMPDGFEPPVPAWSANWSYDVTRLTSGFFGIQGPENAEWRQWVANFLYTHDGAPELVEKALFDDAADMTNTVYIAYWRNSNFDQWWKQQSVSSWWADDARLDEHVGYWREIYHVPIDRLETLHSSPNTHGMACLAGQLDGPIDEHAYPGAARDRIPASGSESLASTRAVERNIRARSSKGGKRVLIYPPSNMCIIRSGQDWGRCDQEERDFYFGEVEPSLRAGMAYLRDNPVESRCLTMRLMQNVDPDNQYLDQTFGLGYALDVYAFEEWAKSHPTHLKIFGQFMTHAEKFGENMQLRLWHEVSVLTAGHAEFEYIACHPRTGLLPYAMA